ncbi:MAG: hypothetical protein Q8K86_01590, partial [Candidatus Nanopelagicaceae bacterium]|nr:hypothetical protein [Candidatus Nanopelagicaceae bacterium]
INDVRKFVKTEGKKILFIDEIARLSRNQSDVLLPFIEDGTVVLVGASTENPFHTLSSPLISRCQILQFEPLGERDLAELLVRGIKHYRQEGKKIMLEEDAARHVIRVSCGDGRKCLTLLEMVVLLNDGKAITLEMVKNAAPNKYMVFGEGMKYDLLSALHGSLQASDPDAAIYWLAKALEVIDVRVIARRLLVAAGEDAYGDPICTAVAHAAFTAAKEIGRPECDILLAQATCLIATSKRDKSAACAVWEALKDVREGKEVWVPKEMRDSHFDGAKELGQGAYHDGMNMKAYVGIEKKYYHPERWPK